MMTKTRCAVFITFLLLVCPACLTAAQIASTVELVAYNKENQTVRDLGPNDLEVRVDGHPIALDSLKWELKQPPRMILLVDTSYASMNNKSLLKDMVTAFIDCKPPQLEMAIATISAVQQFLSNYQRSADELVSTLEKLKYGGTAPFSQALLDALSRFDSDPSMASKDVRKVVVAFSDGSDDSAGSQRDRAQKTLLDNGYVFYEINYIKALKAIFDFKYVDKDLVRLAEETRGRGFRLNGLEDVGRVAREIYDRETNTYLATFSNDTRISTTDLNRFKVKSRRRDVRVEVVAVH